MSFGATVPRNGFDTRLTTARERRLRAGPHAPGSAEAVVRRGGGAGRIDNLMVILPCRCRLDPEAGGHGRDVTDRIDLRNSLTIPNRSQFRRFGVMLAKLRAVIRSYPETGRPALEQAA